MDTINDNFTFIIPSNTTAFLPNPASVDLSLSFQFWFLLICEIPSLICYVFVLTHILIKKSQRQAIHNHSVLVLLFISLSIVLFDYSWLIDTCRRGKVWPQTSAFCQVWWFLDYGFYNACTVVLAWLSFERHILIFHSNVIVGKQRLIVIHYLPLITILIYLAIFYTYAIFFPSCENTYDFTSPVCGAFPCYLTIPLLAMWDTIVHGIIPTLLIAILNIALFVRILWQKRRYHRQWKKYRKMAFQLFSISILYLSLNFPLMITFVVQLAGYPEWGVQAQQYLYFFCTLIQYLFPFVCLPYLSGMWSKMKRLFTQSHQRVAPMVIAGTNRELQQETRM
jgi:hypothetical protein